jgi:hypothetical protein
MRARLLVLRPWRPTVYRLPRTPFLSRSVHEASDIQVGDEIPFNDESLSVQKQSHSTITPQERAVFARLFRNVANPVAVRSQTGKKATGRKGQQISKVPRLQKHVDKDRNILERLPPDIQLMAATAAEKIHYQQYISQIRDDLQSKPEADTSLAGDETLRKLQEEQYVRISGLILSAKTDLQLWEVLEKEVFSVIKSLDLDLQTPRPARKAAEGVELCTTDSQTDDGSPGKSNSLKSGKRAESEFAIAGPNYPSLLITAMRQLRVEFPSSTLPFAILPATKRLGRSSYVIGASTVLYNELIAATWATHGDFRQVDELLHEMDNAGLEFDANTLSIIHSIRREGNYGRRGTYGQSSQAVWKSEFVQAQWRRLIAWGGIIQQRLEADALRQANQEEYSSLAREN